MEEMKTTHFHIGLDAYCTHRAAPHLSWVAGDPLDLAVESFNAREKAAASLRNGLPELPVFQLDRVGRWCEHHGMVGLDILGAKTRKKVPVTLATVKEVVKVLVPAHVLCV